MHDEVNRAHFQILSFLNLNLKCYGMQKKDVFDKLSIKKFFFSFEQDTQLQFLKMQI